MESTSTGDIHPTSSHLAIWLTPRVFHTGKQNVVSLQHKLWPEQLEGSRSMLEVSNWMLDLKSDCWAFEIYEMRKQECWGERGLLEIVLVSPWYRQRLEFESYVIAWQGWEGNWGKGKWPVSFSRALSVSLTLISSNVEESKELRLWRLQSAEI